MEKINFNQEVGQIINNFKSIEYNLNCIIANFVSPKEYAFFYNLILHSSVMPTANKIKVIDMICKIKDEKYNFDKLHILLGLRNLFAHEDYYMESTEEGLIMTIDVFKNGKYDIAKIQDKIKEFHDLFKEVNKEIKDLNARLAKKCQPQRTEEEL